MRVDRPSVTPDTIGAKIGGSIARSSMSRSISLGGNGLGEGLWDTLTGALGSIAAPLVKAAVSLAPAALLKVTGATDQINTLLGQVSAYRQAVYSRILSLDSVMSRQIPPMTMSADPNIRQTGANLRADAIALRAKGAAYYSMLLKNEQDLRSILNNITISADYVTSSLAVIQRIVGEGGAAVIQGKDFDASFNAYMTRFQSEYNRVYETSKASVVKAAVEALPEDVSKAITAAGAAIKSAQPWLIPGLILGLVALIGLRSRR